MEPLTSWRPAFPAGRLDAIYLHWSGGDYASTFTAYHFCVLRRDDGIAVAHTHDLAENMRDVARGGNYAAHTAGRNAYTAGISAMAMGGATPANFGPYPLTPDLIDGLCRVAAAVASFYRISVDARHVLTHAEAAVADGYFGDGDDERWDIARLRPSDGPLCASEAAQTGDELRRLVALHVAQAPAN